MKWSITEKFHDYLYGARFSVLTDNNPLTYVLTSAKLDATGHRWLAALAAYQFDIKYRAGKLNTDADALSRLAPARCKINSSVVSAVCQIQQMQPWGMALSITPKENQLEEPLFSFISGPFSGWKEAQRNDPAIGPWFPFVAQKFEPDRKQLPDATIRLLRHFDKLRLINGVLYRCVNINDEQISELKHSNNSMIEWDTWAEIALST